MKLHLHVVIAVARGVEHHIIRLVDLDDGGGFKVGDSVRVLASGWQDAKVLQVRGNSYLVRLENGIEVSKSWPIEVRRHGKLTEADHAAGQWDLHEHVQVTREQEQPGETDALALPVGTTGQRPGSPLDGMIRYNSTTPVLEAYVNGAWTTLTTGGGGGTSRFIYDEDRQTSCDISRSQEVYTGCGFTYQRKQDRDKECGPGGTSKFIPAE